MGEAGGLKPFQEDARKNKLRGHLKFMQTTYLNASVELDFDLRRLQIRSEEHSVVVTEKKSKIKGFEHCGAVLHKWVRQ